MLCPLHFFLSNYFKDLDNQGNISLTFLNLHFIMGKEEDKITHPMGLWCGLSKTIVMKLKAIKYIS